MNNVLMCLCIIFSTEDRLKFTTNYVDPYEMSISTGPSRYTSGRQSHMTPMTVASADSGKALRV